MQFNEPSPNHGGVMLPEGGDLSRRKFLGVAAASAALVAYRPVARALRQEVGDATTSTTGAQIQFANWGSTEAATKPYFAQFISKFDQATGAKVKSVGWPYQNFEQLCQLRVKAHQSPDVAQLDIDWVTTFAAEGTLVDLNTVYKRADLERTYPANLLKLGQRNGQQVALPWTIASIALVANTKLLAKVGVRQMPRTTAEFAAVLATVKKAQPNVIPYALDTKTPSLITPFFEPWMWTFGGNVVKNGKIAIGSKGTAQALKYLAGLISEGLIQKDVDIFDARTLFAQGKVAFYDDAIIAQGLVEPTNKTLAAGVLPVPRPVVSAGMPPQSIQWGHALVMFKGSRSASQDAAAAQLLTDLESAGYTSAYFKSQGLIPATTAGLKKASYSSSKYETAWANITKTSRFDETAAYVAGPQMSTIIGQEAQDAYLGIASPTAAAQAMASQLGQISLT